MGIKESLKKIPLARALNTHLKARDFGREKKFFLKNYMYSKPVTKEKLEYSLLFEVHGLEKGFTVREGQRPFGVNRVKKIIKTLVMYDERDHDQGFAYDLALSALSEYCKLYEEKKWTNREEYQAVSDYLRGKKCDKKLPVGAYDLQRESIKRDALIDYDKFLSSRKSVRNYSSKKLSDRDIEKAICAAGKTPSACNRQMCKAYYVDSADKKKVIEKYAQGLKLFDLKNANYFIVTFDVNANYFVGEKNQGWFNAGLFTMNLMNAFHSLGIGSCPVQFGNSFKEEKKIKELLDIPQSERISVILIAGYYDEVSRVPYSTRKPVEEIYKKR